MTASRARALRFVVAMGVVSLWADLCYEGIRAAVGPYLESLGADAGTVGLIAGTGELIGYGLRWVAGRVADRSGRYWTLTFIGYGTNLVVAPLLAVVGSWQAVAVLVMMERLGKAVRSPAKSTLVSLASDEVGAGKVFGIHTAMDQLGGVGGPLVVAAVLAGGGGYRGAFAALTVAAALAVISLAVARRYQPPATVQPKPTAPWSRRAVLGYLAGVSLVAFGLADWALLSFHQERVHVWSSTWVVAAYAGAMAIEGVVALGVGRLYERWPARAAWLLAGATVVGLGYPFLALSAAPVAVAVGVVLWASVTSTVDTVAKAGIADRVPAAGRAGAYGLYYAVFGVAWWLGSATLGFAYDRSPATSAAVAVAALAAGAAVLLVVGRRTGSRASADLP
ncbi:MAG: MFS transporter [Kofleriaceae bacterium]